MKFILCLLATTLSLCSTTQPRKSIKKSHNQSTTHKSKATLVDSNWMEKYKESEKKYDYSIEQDSQIKAVGGKYRVPQEVIDHNIDMTKAEP